MTDEELNEAVVRKLGWKECECAPQFRDEHKRYMPSKHIIPNYSRSIEAAWEIVEQPGLWVIVNRILNRKFGTPESSIYTTYHCEIFRNHSDNRAIGEADTAPRAICEAFLKLEEVSK